MVWFLLIVPVSIFMLFVAPVWLWLHYSKTAQQAAQLDPFQQQTLSQLMADAQKMRERIQALEAILDAEHPQWRQP
jgi:phage shock protein B